MNGDPEQFACITCPKQLCSSREKGKDKRQIQNTTTNGILKRLHDLQSYSCQHEIVLNTVLLLLSKENLNDSFPPYFPVTCNFELPNDFTCQHELSQNISENSVCIMQYLHFLKICKSKRHFTETGLKEPKILK